MKDNPKIVAIIQARLGSSRLPLKSLLSLRDIPIINWVTWRVSQAKHLDQYIVAIPDTQLDQVLADHLERLRVPYFLGSENDLLDRYIQAARSTSADLVVRICADNPLIWWQAIDQLIEHFLKHKPDYAYNHIPRNNLWPDGLGAEILSFGLLEDLGRMAKLSSEREHCLNYIWNHPSDFKISTFDPDDKFLCRPDLKLDIDTVDDFQRLAQLPITPDIDGPEIVKIMG
ncbi:MAG: glycosyl transferase family 2 [Desulfovibrionaceae bacterium]|nr:glycosyl transferase family 2 [Desulfovibrionaceae bacterium]